MKRLKVFIARDDGQYFDAVLLQVFTGGAVVMLKSGALALVPLDDVIVTEEDSEALFKSLTKKR